MSHELYVEALNAMFLFWNATRVLTYLPTIGKLLTPEADVRSYSLVSWVSWALSNGTFALMLLEMSRGIPTQMFWLNVANTLMCVIVSVILLLKQFRQVRASKVQADDGGARHARGVPNVRGGRLMLRIAPAGVLAVCGVSTVAYGVWSYDEHHTDIGTVTNAHPAPAVMAQTNAAQPALTPNQAGVPLAPSPAHGATLASTEFAPSATAAPIDQQIVLPATSPASQPGATQPARANFAAPQRRHASPYVKTNSTGPFNFGNLFHPRPGYRQQRADQRDYYAHR
jgi:hypothetical protein